MVQGYVYSRSGYLRARRAYNASYGHSRADDATAMRDDNEDGSRTRQ